MSRFLINLPVLTLYSCDSDFKYPFLRKIFFCLWENTLEACQSFINYRKMWRVWVILSTLCNLEMGKLLNGKRLSNIWGLGFDSLYHEKTSLYTLMRQCIFPNLGRNRNNDSIVLILSNHREYHLYSLLWMILKQSCWLQN